MVPDPLSSSLHGQDPMMLCGEEEAWTPLREAIPRLENLQTHGGILYTGITHDQYVTTLKCMIKQICARTHTQTRTHTHHISSVHFMLSILVQS
ncbi:unnamed protein product [Oncorhynchus mykiss]|uniref:Uncharacterized protein n=1 Tax=Oncorhynchus mykiss TaxID=8022 RepID=A0A060XUE3_ONCMY|nr:unnamed protein product [Oncorhynchus mykiss]